MKTFKIIGVIALLIVLFEFIGGFNDGWSDVDKLAHQYRVCRSGF